MFKNEIRSTTLNTPNRKEVNPPVNKREVKEENEMKIYTIIKISEDIVYGCTERTLPFYFKSEDDAKECLINNGYVYEERNDNGYEWYEGDWDDYTAVIKEIKLYDKDTHGELYKWSV